MLFTSATKLKAWIKNKSKQTNIPADVLYKIFMLERLLERIALSKYRSNLIIKGGFLIASMIGIDLRSTMDMDTTIKNIELNRNIIIDIMNEIIGINIDDGISFVIRSVKDIHEESEYDDFRMILLARFYNIKVYVQVDFTTGHVVIPNEIEYSYKLMFEDRTIPIMAYNLDTIFAEKIEAILSRHIDSTRMRDYYDVYILILLNKEKIQRDKILNAVRIKAKERDTLEHINGYKEHLLNISNSPEMQKRWENYVQDYPYADGIEFLSIIKVITWLFEGEN